MNYLMHFVEVLLLKFSCVEFSLTFLGTLKCNKDN